jgi:hypothetical protein
MKTITGGCLCGAIHYVVTAEPIVTFNRHCRDCQKASGGRYTPVFYVPANAFTSELRVAGFSGHCRNQLD